MSRTRRATSRMLMKLIQALRYVLIFAGEDLVN
jgi:hypothetical protein